MPRTYESQLQFFVSTVDSSDNSQLAQGSTFLQQRVKSYSQLVESPVILQPVIQELGLNVDASDLAKDVSATIPTDTVLIDVTVQASSPTNANRIATAIGDQFPKTISSLETVSSTKSPVKVTLTKPPTLETSAVSPQPVRNLALAGALGLLGGIGVALLAHVLDTKVRSKEDIEALTEDTAVIGAIPFDAAAVSTPLLLESGPLSTRSESFRALRTNLSFVGTAARARAIVMTSTLPGEGKTTTTANLGVVLAESGASVCLVEADLRRPRLLEYFGMEGAVGLTDLLIGRADLVDLLQPFGRNQLSLLGAGQIPPNPSELLGSPAMKEVLQQLTEKFDYVLLDAPPMLAVTDAAVLSTIADGAVLVVGSGLVTREQFKSALNGLEQIQARVLGIALNRVPRDLSRGGYYYQYEYQPRRERVASVDRIEWDEREFDEISVHEPSHDRG
jgi:capsular exopolysaccharide synthesis family protein